MGNTSAVTAVAIEPRALLLPPTADDINAILDKRRAPLSREKAQALYRRFGEGQASVGEQGGFWDATENNAAAAIDLVTPQRVTRCRCIGDGVLAFRLASDETPYVLFAQKNPVFKQSQQAVKRRYKARDQSFALCIRAVCSTDDRANQGRVNWVTEVTVASL
jgi:hypothetical protein